MTTPDALAYLLILPKTTYPGWRWSDHKTAGGYEHHQPTARYVCAEAGLEADVGILACAAASEFRQDHPAELLAGCNAIITDARERKVPISIESRVTMLGLRRKWNKLWTAYPAAGYLGRQSGRWCSSWQKPSLRTVEAARLALQGVGMELAQGARRWIDGRVQDGGVQAGKRLKDDAVAILRSRYSEGWRWVGPMAGITSYRLILLGRRGRPVEEALAMVEEGRRG